MDNQKKILFVDDNQLIRQVVSDFLKKNNYEVHLACGGFECLEKIANTQYDLIILDYSMPDKDGLEVLTELVNQKSEIPVIMLTGEGSESVAADAMKLGALDYVIKKDNYCELILNSIKETFTAHEKSIIGRRIRRQIIDIDPEKEIPREALLEKNKILVVDDSALVRKLLCDTLERNNYIVDSAANGAECLEYLARNVYDLVLLDYHMPDLDGLQVLEEIVNKKYNIPVIMLTGEGSEEVSVRAMKLGALDYVNKDIGYIEIIPDIVRDNIYIYSSMLAIANGDKIEGIVEVKEKILVVDDCRTATSNVGGLLSSQGYAVDIALNGKECLEKIAQNTYDLLLIDYHMPGMNGLQVTEEIKKRGYDIPVIILTGKGSEEIAVRAMKLGAQDYIVKSVGYLAWLLEVVHRNLKLFEIKKEKKILEEKLAQRNKELENRIYQLRALNEISKEIHENLNLNTTLSIIITKITGLLACARVTIMLCDQDNEYLTIKAAKGFPIEELDKVKIKIGEGISGSVAASGEVLFIPNIEEDPRFQKRNSEQYFTKSLISVPLRIRDKIIGVINVNNKRNNESFTIDDKDILTTISFSAAIAIDKSRYCEMLMVAGVTDNLTGLYNQRHFYDVLNIEIDKVKRYKTHFALMLIDMDGFKQINDTHGHLQGDIVLTSVAQLIAKTIRKPDILARYGGDEFILIMPQTSSEDAIALAQRIKSGLGSFRCNIEGLKDLSFSVSMGIVEYKKGMSIEKIIETTDKALYLAKQQGKNSYYFIPTEDAIP